MVRKKTNLTLIREKVQEWEVIDPSGSIEIKSIKPAPRLNTLEGKTVLLRWNFKHNGNHFLDRISELLLEKVPKVRIIKLYEVDKSTINQSGSIEDSQSLAKIISNLNPDIVISAYGD